MLQLLSHPSPWVRLAAAFDCMTFAEAESLRELQNLSVLSGFVGFTAERMLTERTKAKTST
ncbi:MAG: hypothetical protein E6K10_10425 [Methanobacteriota archaeon]|nr:MAG: hypothetical protein E6K10_10425 [Euryarchaeota archaeon]